MSSDTEEEAARSVIEHTPGKGIRSQRPTQNRQDHALFVVLRQPTIRHIRRFVENVLPSRDVSTTCLEESVCQKE